MTMNLRVLVIDDDDVSRELLCSVLESAGHTTLSLPTPIGATQLIQEQNIQAVVIDVMMPALTGDRLAQLLKKNPRFRDLGIVLVTGDSSQDLESLARKAGAHCVVSKGAVRQQLRRAVEGSVGASVRPQSRQTGAPPNSCQRMVEATQRLTKIVRESGPVEQPRPSRVKAAR
jgi:CheY-like chemotaxis protein